MKKFLLFLNILFFLSYSFSQEDTYEGKQEDPDMMALRRWIKTKRLVTVKEIGGDLSLSGEVRTEFQGINEKKDGVEQRGRGGATNKPAYAYDVEFNFMLDYLADRTWASVKLEFDNDMGQVSGVTNKIALERCYLGGKFYEGETFSIIGTIGRRNLGDVFDSKIEFSSLFDGIDLRFSKSFESIGNFSTDLAALLVDDRKNHYAYVGEIDLLRIGNTGFFTKYSFISWKKWYKKERKRLSFRFLISQLILGYQFNVGENQRLVKFYLSGLLNHAARPVKDLTGKEKAEYGGYVGFSVGRVQKKGDWALDVNYQIVGAQAIPDFDVGGVKRGNAAGIGFYTVDNYGRGPDTTKEDAVGSGNYKGIKVEFLYALTNNLTLLMDVEASRNLDYDIGPKMKYSLFEIEFIYAF
ncbi:MAG: hypothetical protein AMS24_02170 [Chlamydiae bacterium SM23_39]|nr:MAG: hypothetical protein AMS24_02170 [Chlamydiae bacterium SM23_39]